MAMPVPEYFTAAMVRALPDDGNRYETVHGELLVTPAPGGMHQLILARLVSSLQPYLAAAGLEQLLFSPADISWSDDTLVQPDLFVAELGDWVRSGEWSDIRTLYLTVEVLSPSTARADRFAKRRLYQEQRIPEYWIVDSQRERIEVWTPDALEPRVERERLVWRHPLLAENCTVDIPALFSRTLAGR